MPRRLIPEHMDDPAVGPAEMALCLRHLAAINRWTAAYRPVRRWLRRFAGQGRVSLLDVGCGGGDGLRHIAAWAARQGMALSLTGLDRHPAVIAAARAATPPGMAIRYLAGDVFACEERFDLVTSSLFTHHLDDAEIVRFLGWMEGHAERGWLVSDLHRHPLPAAVVRAAAALLPVSPLVAHDAPVSVGRAFTRDDWTALLRRAGLAQQARIVWRMPFRLSVERCK